NTNSSAEPVVLAQHNNFGAGPGDNIEHLLFDDTDSAALAPVVYSQSTLVITCPPAAALQCLADIPPPKATYAEFIAPGGSISASAAAITSEDSVFTPSPRGGSFVRKYFVLDPCGLDAECEQLITVSDTLAPVPSVPNLPTIIGECGAEISNVPTA